MKKLGLLIIALLVCVIFGCVRAESNVEGNGYVINKDTIYQNIDLSKVCDVRYIGDNLAIDETTGIIYYMDLTGNRMSILFKEDGTPKNIVDYVGKSAWLDYLSRRNQ